MRRVLYPAMAGLIALGVVVTVLINVKQPPRSTSFKVAKSHVSGTFHNGDQRVVTLRCDNSDGQAMLRIEQAIKESGAAHIRDTPSNRVYQLDPKTTVSVGRPATYLGKTSTHFRFKSASGQEYCAPIATFRGVPGRLDIAAVIVHRDDRKGLLAWF